MRLENRNRIRVSLENQGGFLEVEAGIAGTKLGLVAVAEVAEEVSFPFAVGEELRVEFGLIEARHGTAVEAEGAGGENEVCGLEGRVAEGRFVDEGLIADEVGAEIGLRGEAWKLLVEFVIPGHDDVDRGGHGFADVAGSDSGFESRFGFGSGDENEAGGRGVGAGGSEAGELVGLAEELVGDGDGQPRRVGAGFVEELIEAGLGDGRAGCGRGW